MSLDGVFADEEFAGDFAVAHALCDQFQDFKFATRDAEIFQTLFIQAESQDSGYRDFFDDQDFLLFGDFETEPDAECSEEQRDESTVDLDRVRNDEETKLDQLQDDDQNAAAKAVDQCVDERLSIHANEL